jgi:hypothetical protein
MAVALSINFDVVLLAVVTGLIILCTLIRHSEGNISASFERHDIDVTALTL